MKLQTKHVKSEVIKPANINPKDVNLDEPNHKSINSDHINFDIGFQGSLSKPGLTRQSEAFALCLSKSLRWNTGDVISVGILNTNDDHTRISSRKTNEIIKHAARTWEHYANISFRFVQDTEPAIIRIKYDDNVNSEPSVVSGWSFVGMAAKSRPKGEPTMMLCIGRYADGSEIHSVALHEFGHVLGMRHEHASPACPIAWDRNFIFRDQGDTVSTHNNILRKENPTDSEFSPFDPRSIMIYNIPPQWTKNGIKTSRGTTLSETDKKWARTYYPFDENKPKPE